MNWMAAKNRPQLLLAAVFLSRLLGALVIWAINGPSAFWSRDTGGYLATAVSLCHGSFSNRGVPEIIITPGYPLLLLPAVISHHPVFVGVVENLILATVSAWLIWQIAGLLAPGSTAAAWALLLYCFEPVGFIYSEKLLTELLFTTELLVFVWLTLRFLRKPALTSLLGCAVVLGLATYTRPISLFLGPWLAPFFLLFPRQLSWRERVVRAGAFVLAFTIVLLPWVIRNIEIAGYHGFSAITDVNLYFYSEAAVQGKLENKSYWQAQQELGYGNDETYFRNHPEQRYWTQAQILRFRSEEARKTIFQHWGLYAIIHLRGCAIVLFDPAATEAMKLLRLYPESGGLIYRATDQGPLKAALWLIRNYPSAILALLLLGTQIILYYLLGVVGLRRLPLNASVFFVFLCCYFILVSGSATAVARFRAPVMPLVCVAAAKAIADWQARRQSDAARAASGVTV